MIKIMLIDDEESNLRMMRGIIDWEEQGYTVVGTASDGQEGVDLYEALQPDVVLVDIRMPIMDGLQFTETIKKRNPQVKIIILSAFGEFEYAQRAIDLGVSSYLLKPLNENKLVDMLTVLKSEFDKQDGKASYQNAIRSAKFLFYDNPMLSGAKTDDEQREFTGLADDYLLDNQLMLYDRVQVCDQPALTKFIEDSFAKFTRERVSPADVFEFCDMVVSIVKRVLHKLNPDLIWQPLTPYKLYRESASTLTCSELRQHLINLVSEGLDLVKKIYEQSRSGSIVWKAKQYTSQHYLDKTFSISDAANFVGLSKSHFSKIYKEYTGENYWDFVIKLKLDKAKYLLKHTNKTNYEISQLIGYESEYHFSRIFSRMIGISTSQFRKQQT